jgi:16S rRNA (guanine527-N7)-methyltransferase
MNLTALQRREFQARENVSRETLERLDHLVAITRKWSKRINLVAPDTLEAIWERHISDSSQLFSAGFHGDKDWLDIGSGGGYPGLVVAVMAAEHQKSGLFTLVESDKSKAIFLQTAIRELGIHAKVENSRIETLAPQNAGIITARALAPLPKLLEMATPHLAPGGICLFPKGRNHLSELTEAIRCWKLSYKILKSRTDPQAGILCIHEAIRV